MHFLEMEVPVHLKRSLQLMSSKSAAAAEAEEEGAVALPLMDIVCMADFAPFVESVEEACLGVLVFVSKTTPDARRNKRAMALKTSEQQL